MGGGQIRRRVRLGWSAIGAPPMSGNPLTRGSTRQGRGGRPLCDMRSCDVTSAAALPPAGPMPSGTGAGSPNRKDEKRRASGRASMLAATRPCGPGSCATTSSTSMTGSSDRAQGLIDMSAATLQTARAWRATSCNMPMASRSFETTIRITGSLPLVTTRSS